MNQDAGPSGDEAGRFVAQAWLLSVVPKMTEINRWINQLPGLVYST